MCQLNHDIRFCSCNEVQEGMRNTWVLHRYQGERGLQFVGQVLFHPIDPATEAYNEAWLLDKVNDPGCWDLDLQPCTNDRLELNLWLDDDEATIHLSYGFRFTGRKWVLMQFDPLGWMEVCDVVKKGEIELKEKRE